MTRLPGWRARLSAYIESCRRRAYAPGEHDCALFVAGAVQAMTGEDIARPWRGYGSIADGMKALRKSKFRSPADALAAILEEIAPSAAANGDLLAFAADDDAGAALGICAGEVAFVLREDGLGLMPTLRAKRAFRV